MSWTNWKIKNIRDGFLEGIMGFQALPGFPSALR